MKNFFLLLLLLFVSCEKIERLNIVLTGDSRAATGNAATFDGTLVDSTGMVSQVGHCWAVDNPEPNLSSPLLYAKGSRRGSTFTTTLSKLDPNTNYYVRGYMIVGDKVTYGKTTTVLTKSAGEKTIDDKTIGRTLVSNITANTATAINQTDAVLTSLADYGHCWTTTDQPDPTLDLNTKTTRTSGASVNNKNIQSNLTGLKSQTSYKIRAYAILSAGATPFYGPTQEFKTGSN